MIVCSCVQTREEQAVYDTLDEAEYEKLVKTRRADANFVECDGDSLRAMKI